MIIAGHRLIMGIVSSTPFSMSSSEAAPARQLKGARKPDA